MTCFDQSNNVCLSPSHCSLSLFLGLFFSSNISGLPFLWDMIIIHFLLLHKVVWFQISFDYSVNFIIWWKFSCVKSIHFEAWYGQIIVSHRTSCVCLPLKSLWLLLVYFLLQYDTDPLTCLVIDNLGCHYWSILTSSLFWTRSLIKAFKIYFIEFVLLLLDLYLFINRLLSLFSSHL